MFGFTGGGYRNPPQPVDIPETLVSSRFIKEGQCCQYFSGRGAMAKQSHGGTSRTASTMKLQAAKTEVRPITKQRTGVGILVSGAFWFKIQRRGVGRSRNNERALGYWSPGLIFCPTWFCSKLAMHHLKLQAAKTRGWQTAKQRTGLGIWVSGADLWCACFIF